jgi:protein SCO1/2
MATGIGCSKETLQFKAVDITGAQYEQAFTPALAMTDADGKPVTLNQFKGKVVVLFFGFTHCPDACPTTLAEVAQAKALLGADGAKVQPIFVTLDPPRDTLAVLKPYVTSFGDDFVALRGSPEHTAQLAKAFKVY